ncbi:MAG: uracil-DNA glycosylase [Burkholderiaceae bacterium]|nr:uracil-DNA glycosylase [Burkholderiaceae bacterium]
MSERWPPRRLAMLEAMGVPLRLPRMQAEVPQQAAAPPAAPGLGVRPVEAPVTAAAAPARAAPVAAEPATPRTAAPVRPAEPAVAPPRPAADARPVQSARPGPVAPPEATADGRRILGVESMDWPALREAVAGCRACGLCESRRQTVFGVGNERAEWMLVGEAPGEQEDRLGEPFVGKAGQLLDNMLRSIGLTRSEAEPARQVYIANVLKCRPPANRNPQPQEVLQCEPFLKRQVELVSPRLILAMGRFAVQSLLGSQEPIGRLRGRVHQYHGVPVIVTYHPAYLLRNPLDKARAWEDLCLAAAQRESGGGATSAP